MSTTEIKTLAESGYSQRPYIHNSRDVCFVWYARDIKTRKEKTGLCWQSFSVSKNSGKLARNSRGDLVEVLVPTEYYGRSVADLMAEAKASHNPTPPKGQEWVGPFLYMADTCGFRMTFGEQGNFMFLPEAPAQNPEYTRTRLGYAANTSFEPCLTLRNAA